jgi:hypothetical protein
MSEILEKAKAHFLDRLKDGTQSLEVPEWGCKVFWRPMSNKQKKLLFKNIERANMGAAVDIDINTLIVRACDENFKPMFKESDRTELMLSVDPIVINRISDAMHKSDTTQEDAEKN